MADDAVSASQINEIFADPEVKEAIANAESVMRVAKKTPTRPGLDAASRYADSRLTAATVDAMNRLGVQATYANGQSIDASLIMREEGDVFSSPEPKNEDNQVVMALEVASDPRMQKMLHILESIQRVKNAFDVMPGPAIHIQEGIVSAFVKLNDPQGQILAQVAKEVGASPEEQAQAKQLLRSQEQADLARRPDPTDRDEDIFISILHMAVRGDPTETVVPHPPATPPAPHLGPKNPPRMKG